MAAPGEHPDGLRKRVITDLAVWQVAGEPVTATVQVANTGGRAGRHGVQLHGTRTVEDSRSACCWAPGPCTSAG